MDNHFKDDLEPVRKKRHGGFDYTCSKCQKVVKEARTIFTAHGKDLCEQCWFDSDYQAEK